MTEADSARLHIQSLIDKADGIRAAVSMLMTTRDDLRNELLLLDITSNNPNVASAARAVGGLGHEFEVDIERIFLIMERLRAYQATL